MSGKYEAKLDFETVVICKNALYIHKAIIEAQSKSAYELSHNKEYVDVCKAIAELEKNL